MEQYNIANLQAGLQELGQQIKGKEINVIACYEQIDPTTVRKYLKGEIANPATAKGILTRGRELVIEREHSLNVPA